MRRIILSCVLILSVTFMTVGCSSYPSVKWGDLKFYVTGVQVQSDQSGFSNIIVNLIAENVGEKPIPFPGNMIVVYVEGKVGSNTYSYKASNLEQTLWKTGLESLPPGFRLQHDLVFNVANTVSNLSLKFEFYERGFVFTNLDKTATMPLNVQGKFPIIDLPVDENLDVLSLGQSIDWCPNSTLTLTDIKWTDVTFNDDESSVLILFVRFDNYSGEALSPYCTYDNTVTLIINERLVFESGLYYSSDSLQNVPPGSHSEGVILSVINKLPTDTHIDKAWVSLRTYTVEENFLWGDKLINDKSGVYEISSIESITFDKFMQTDYGLPIETLRQDFSP